MDLHKYFLITLNSLSLFIFSLGIFIRFNCGIYIEGEICLNRKIIYNEIKLRLIIEILTFLIILLYMLININIGILFFLCRIIYIF